MARMDGKLSRQKVLEAALQLIDQEGLEGFSMRKLGTMLGVEAMSLYNHIENKRALFDGVVELLFLQAPFPQRPEAEPAEQLWEYAHALRDVLRAHPRALPLLGPLRTAATLGILDRLLSTVYRAHITGVAAIYVLQCISGYIIGQTLLDVGRVPVAGLEPGTPGPEVWQHFPAKQFPTLHAALPDIAHWDPDQEFEFGLKALVQGIFQR